MRTSQESEGSYQHDGSHPYLSYGQAKQGNPVLIANGGMADNASKRPRFITKPIILVHQLPPLMSISQLIILIPIHHSLLMQDSYIDSPQVITPTTPHYHDHHSPLVNEILTIWTLTKLAHRVSVSRVGKRGHILCNCPDTPIDETHSSTSIHCRPQQQKHNVLLRELGVGEPQEEAEGFQNTQE